MLSPPRLLYWDIDITIRQATLFDAAIIVRFNLLLAQETEDLTLDLDRVTRGVKALLNDPAKGAYHLAEVDGVIVGQLLITREWSDWRNGAFWWLQSVYVDPAFRRRGVFRALFQQAQALAQKRDDVCGLRLYMDTHNMPARQTYERLGMRDTDYELLEMDFVLRHPESKQTYETHG